MDDAESYIRTDDESLLATDDAESYVRTDEEQSISFKTDEEAELYDGHPKVSLWMGSLKIRLSHFVRFVCLLVA